MNGLLTSKTPMNGIENVWNQAKRHWRRFNGVAREHFHLFLKECEWRFDNSDPKSQLKQLTQWVRSEMGSLSRTALFQIAMR